MKNVAMLKDKFSNESTGSIVERYKKRMAFEGEGEPPALQTLGEWLEKAIEEKAAGEEREKTQLK